MALGESRKITINGASTIDGTVAERHTAVIDEDNPKKDEFVPLLIYETQQLKERITQLEKGATI